MGPGLPDETSEMNILSPGGTPSRLFSISPRIIFFPHCEISEKSYDLFVSQKQKASPTVSYIQIDQMTEDGKMDRERLFLETVRENRQPEQTAAGPFSL